MKLLGLAAGALVILIVTSLLLYPLCNALFLCGCGPMWGSAAAHCNVHADHGAHCPWCEHSALGAFGFVFTLAVQGVVFVLARWGRRSVLAATLLALVALPLATGVSAGVSWLATDYPHFLVKDARARMGIPAGPLATVR